MKPYYSKDGITIYNADCMDVMQELDENSFDILLVDPPYGIEINKMGFTKSGKVKAGKAFRNDYRAKAEWDSKRIDKKVFDEMFRISKDQIIFGGNYYTDILPPTKSWIVWDKKCEDKYSNDYADCELAWASKGQARVFRWLWHGMIQQDMKNKEKRVHPTQKPIPLFIKILERYTKQTDYIIDPFMGSGTTLAAAKKLGRKAVGIEISKEYCDIAIERIENANKQLNLLDISKI